MKVSDFLTEEFKKTLIGKTCIWCKCKITDYKDVTVLIGGSAPPDGKPMHKSCYERKQEYWFR